MLVLDRMLPGQDGLAVLQALRRGGSRVPALIVSALGEVDEHVRGLRAGGDDYLVKPFALVEMTARIEALLRRPADTRETWLRVARWSSTSSQVPQSMGDGTSTCCRASSGCSNT